jgi:hypothetical protein
MNNTLDFGPCCACGHTRQLANCLRKKRYHSLAEAQRHARYRSEKSGIVFTAYECEICYWFHLTSAGFVGQDKK